MAHKITNANIKEWARDYQGELFDAILCDPPYELGFMGKSWDSSGIAFDQDMWADLLRILKPGGHLLAFSGSRTYHRMAVAIEDAGFEIRDMIEWVYGSGFPKSLNIGKAVDKIQGNEREVTGSYFGAVQNPNSVAGGLNASPNADANGRTTVISTKGNSPYEGYGTALKPAHEPCVLARKPIEGTVANNVLKHGTGGLNIDGTRVGFSGDSDKKAHADTIKHYKTGNPQDNSWKNSSPIQNANEQVESGRFPANLIHDGSDEVEAVFPNESSRFFYTAKASKSERNAGLEGFEEKSLKGFNASPREAHGEVRDVSLHTNPHPTVKPLSLTKYLATLIQPPTGGRLLVPFSGSGSEMIGGLQAGWEYVEGVELTEEYIPIAEARIKYWTNLKEEESNQLELI